DQPFAVDLGGPDADASIDAAAADIAGFVDQRLAELAYTVEGATEFLSRTHPEMSGRPVVVFGYSAGALAAPAIAARLKATLSVDHGEGGNRLAGLIVVCGGSNLLAIAEGSVVADPKRLLSWSSPPTREQRERLAAGYLAHTRLDPSSVGPT